MAQSSFIIRLGVRDVDTVKAALLGIGKDGERALKKIERASVQASGGFRRFNATTALTQRAVAGLTATIASFAAALSVRALVAYSDQWTQINNRLKLVTASSAELAEVQKDLFGIAQESRASFGDLAELYGRVALASKELGVSQRDQAQFAEGVAKALAITGTSAAQARGSLLQLGQAIGGGTVRAEEFNSILEGTPRIAQAVADGLNEAGGSVARLRQLVIDGEVSSRAFFDAFLTQVPVLRSEFDSTATTIDQAFTVLGNSMLQAVGRFNDATDASSKFAEALKSVGAGIDAVSDPLARGIKQLREWKEAALEALRALPATVYRATGGTAFVPGSGFAGSPEQGGRRPGQRALTTGGVSLGGGPSGFDPEKIRASLEKAKVDADKFLKRITEANLQATGQLVALAERRRDEELKALETLAANEEEKAAARVKINQTAEAEIAEIRERGRKAPARDEPGLDVGAIRAAIDDAKAKQEDARQVAISSLERIRDANLQATGQIIALIERRRDREIAALEEMKLTEEEVAEARVLINATANQEIAAEQERVAEQQRRMSEESMAVFRQFGQTASRVFADMVVSGEFTAQSIIDSFKRILVDNAFQQIFGLLSGAAGSVFGSLFAGGGGSAGFAGVLGSPRAAGVVHAGGVIGQTPTPIRFVHPSVFDGARRFHNGLASDEFPAILQRGETVTPKGASPALNVIVNNNAGAEVSARQTGGGVTIDIDAMVAKSLSRQGSLAGRAVDARIRQAQAVR